MPSFAARVKPSRTPSLFDLPPHDEPDPTPTPTPEPVAPVLPVFARGEKAKARDLLAAIRALKTIEAEQRPATAEERQTLARFAGFGPVALSIFPDPVTGRYKDAGWQTLGDELKSLLTTEEYASAKRSIFNAFYTAPAVIAAMYTALARLGVPSDARVLEPGCGIGNFLAYAPPAMRFVGVELDAISGRIARLLHPAADIRIEDFRDTRLPNGSLDAVIGNVPFADVRLDYRGQKLALHDYCFAKSLDALKPGGILALVTSHFTLDKQNAALREHLAATADFLGAIRLPSDAFHEQGTAVVADIVFLRKRGPSEPARHADPDWLTSIPLTIDGVAIPISRYFHTHPEMVLGTWSRQDTLYGGDSGYSVRSNGDLAKQLREATARLPQLAPTRVVAVAETRPRFTPPPPERHLAEGSFVLLDDRRIGQCVGGTVVPVVYGGKTLHADGSLVGRRLAALIGLRDRARRVLQSQNEGWPEPDRLAARRELNRAYDRFTATYGPINTTTFGETADGSTIRRMPNLVKFRDDPDAMIVMALEEYDEVTGEATKAAILRKDVVGPAPPITLVASAEDGLLVSLDQRGAVDVPFIATLYGHTEERVIAELGDLLYRDPESQTWQTADAYLSGPVRAKLAAADRAGPDYTRNVEALHAVQPEDVLPGDIDAHLGAPWIPTTDIQAFAAEVFGVPLASVQVEHLASEAVWSVEGDYSAQRSVAATSDYGTVRVNGFGLLDLALNLKTPVIYDPVPGDPDKRVVNSEATLAAREKQRLLKDRFRSWVFADPERTERFVRRYNDIYNNLRPQRFDGSHLAFPGLSHAITLHPHQKDAIWRGMSHGNTLLAHVVGAGKTFTMAATGMKMKQAGLIHKPMFVVPNHMLEQFARDFLHLYPNARLLIAGKDDLTRDRRKMLTAQIASGDWDGIIVTHSSFERIGLSRDAQATFLRQQIAEYDELLRNRAAGRGSRAHRNLTKTIEKQKASREAKLKDLLAADKKDDGLVFDELGVDHLFIDEAHAYKNLETPTKMSRVAGIPAGGSERAFDLYLKTQYLHAKHPGHGVTFATGTPISNTMVELYTMQRYLDPDGLKSRGLGHFDAWAATFGEVVDTMEIAPDGKTLRPRSRFAKFTNLPELQQMFHTFADVQTAAMLNLPRPRLAGGKATVVACPMSDEQHGLQQDLVARYERIRAQKIDPRVDNALAITTDGRKLALDSRLLSRDAADFPDSKVNTLVDRVVSIWRRTVETRGTQMVFCDLGVQPTAWGYSVYDDIFGKLMARGIPAEQMAVVGEADSDAKKQALFEKVRSGSVRVLLGSTQKMGAGTNVQKRLVALHHLDAPWKPAEVEQREGRILRPGNECEEVEIFRYVTEGSFDAYLWQALETKARFIAQVMTGEAAVRRAEDVGGQELSYAEVKAIASGNPAVLTLAEADAELQRLAVLQKNHLDEQYLARRRVRDLPAVIARLEKRLTDLTADSATVSTQAHAPMVVGGRSGDRTDAALLTPALNRIPDRVSQPRRFPLGQYCGLAFGLERDPNGATDVYLEGVTTRRTQLAKDSQGPRAVMNALQRLVTSSENEVTDTRQELTLAHTQLRDYEARLGNPFPYADYLSELTRLRDQLRGCLSKSDPDPTDDATPSASELATQIQSLRSAHTVESPSGRAGSSRPTAEEPITVRLRQRRSKPGTVPHSTEGEPNELTENDARPTQAAFGR